jgi:hypothetical protein
MTDRELLELAAKAAGCKPPHRYSERLNAVMWFSESGFTSIWSPLTDNKDAFELMVELKIDVMHTNTHSPQVHAMADHEVACIEDSATDPLAATRRAIVRAAAEIGKAMP